MQDNGRVCAVGSTDGSVTILQLSEGLVQAQASEKRVISAVSSQSINAYVNIGLLSKEQDCRCCLPLPFTRCCVAC